MGNNTRVMALDGLAQFLKTVEMVKDRLNPDLKINEITPCQQAKGLAYLWMLLMSLKSGSMEWYTRHALEGM